MDGNATSQHHDITDSSTATASAAHPLQDVELSLSASIPESSTKTVKKNWVKFDDDTNEGDGNDSGRNNNASESSSNVAAPRSTTASDTEQNKLSQLPPPPAVRQSLATTTTLPNTNTNSVTPMEKNMNKHSATVAPVQRATVSSSTAEADVAPAVLTTESTHVNLNASVATQQQEKRRQQQQQYQQQQQQQQQPKTSNVLSGSSPMQIGTAASSSTTTTTSAISPLHGQQHHSNNGTSNNNNNNKTHNVTIPMESTQPMRTIELSTGRIREGFANGDVIVTLLPANTKWPWITPAIFRPELVPEELMAQGLTLTVEEYVNAMETLVNDYRFTVYNICYKRILVCWILFAFAVLLALLFSGLQGVALFSLGVGWLFLNAAAIFLCMWVKLRLARGLEKCLARVNRQLMRHKILLILDDRGRLSCHKVNLCFLYFDAAQCVNYLNEFLEQTEQNGGDAIKAGWEAKLDLDLNDIVIQGNNPVRLSRKQERGMQLFLRYGSRWGMEALRGLVDVTPLDPGRHCGQFQCPCQYIKQHLQCKPRGKCKISNCIYWVLASERYDY